MLHQTLYDAGAQVQRYLRSSVEGAHAEPQSEDRRALSVPIKTHSEVACSHHRHQVMQCSDAASVSRLWERLGLVELG